MVLKAQRDAFAAAPDFSFVPSFYMV